MTPNISLESLSFSLLLTEETFIKIEHDPDVKFYNNVFTLDTKYLEPDKFQKNFRPFSKQLLSVLPLNILRINENFNFNFSIVFFFINVG